jgi:hypothetical protein
MAKTKRGSSRKRSSATDEQAGGTGGFLGQVGLFETANGLPHGPAAVALAIGAAILIYPVTRLIRAVRGR